MEEASDSHAPRGSRYLQAGEQVCVTLFGCVTLQLRKEKLRNKEEGVTDVVAESASRFSSLRVCFQHI